MIYDYKNREVRFESPAEEKAYNRHMDDLAQVLESHILMIANIAQREVGKLLQTSLGMKCVMNGRLLILKLLRMKSLKLNY